MKYTCDVCGENFNEEKACLECENKHKITVEEIEKANEKRRADFEKVNEALKTYQTLKDQYDKDWRIKSLSSYNGKYYADGIEVSKKDYMNWLSGFFYRW